MLKVLNWTEHSRSAKLAEGMGPVDWLVGEVGMLKASNWAEHSQRGLKETKGEKEELRTIWGCCPSPHLRSLWFNVEGFLKRAATETSTAAAPAPILEVPGLTLRGS